MRHLLSRMRARIERSRRQTVPGRQTSESVDIGRLICPLRYDVRLRINFIRFLDGGGHRHIDDVEALLDSPESKQYFVWFKEVACARNHPRIYHDDGLVRQAFLDRVHRTAMLWWSIRDQGYDWSRPIHLRTGRVVRKVNGKTINSEYFAANGCHRLACLYLLGQRLLDPEQYQIEIDRTYRPLDNTATLIKHLPLDRLSYLRFLSDFYCDGMELESPHAIRQRVAETKPHLLPELESVLSFDLAILAPQ